MGFTQLKSMQVITLTNCSMCENPIKHKKSGFETLQFLKIQTMVVKWLFEPHLWNL